MQSQDVAPRHAPAAGPATVERAEASLVEHYARLARLAYLVLPPRLGRGRRVLTAHALTQRALPRGRELTGRVPAQHSVRGTARRDPADPAAREYDAGYVFLRERVLHAALTAEHPRWTLPPLLPRVWGLRLLPRSGGGDELALEQRLSLLPAPARAAYVLRGLDRLADQEIRNLLMATGVDDPAGALAMANSVPTQPGLLSSPEFDPCALQARPTDLLRRRRHTRAALAAAAVLAVCGALLALPRSGWGPDGAAAPVYAGNPAARAALDPARLTRVSPTAWRSAARTDFSAWPTRGPLTGDKELLRRALAVWARPGHHVQVAATPGTQTGGPAGPPQLLYAGQVDAARVVLLYDGLRIARYAEPAHGTEGAAMDLARVDGATDAEASALVLGRADGNVQYLLAPWVKTAASRDLMTPDAPPTALTVTDGVTAPLASPALKDGHCASWTVLQLSDDSGTRLSTDLGELVPAHLTAGRPDAADEADGPEGRRAWAPFACSLATERSSGVRSVNAWDYAQQPLPDGSGTGQWACTRAETWRGGGTTTLAQFHLPDARHGAVTARGTDTRACGPRDPHVLSGVLWKSRGGHWYLLAAGSPDTVAIHASAGITASAPGSLLVSKAAKGARAHLKGTLAGGRTIDGLR
ncbi:hypothetical protein [Streptomyces sp. NPDC048106]|uniref:hypothetical protein n=1 Tax=Streptomyces sp. NPDC048106 TaxID=3155750 RepID=UPI0034538B38